MITCGSSPLETHSKGSLKGSVNPKTINQLASSEPRTKKQPRESSRTPLNTHKKNRYAMKQKFIKTHKIKTEVANFRTHLERLGYSKTSVNMLPNCLGEFLSYQGHCPVKTITPADIIRYHQYLQERPHQRRAGGLSESYIHHHIYSLKLFFGWQEEQGNITANPISSLEFPRPKSKAREVLTQSEIQALYTACETLKEKAVLSLFYGCGLRRSEGEKLNLKDIHFRSNLLYVREGKGKKRRAVPLSPQVARDLKNYIYKERYSPKNSQSRANTEVAAITNRIGKRTSGYSYNKLLKTLLERASIKKEISLHSLRHSIATHLLERGLTVEYVRDFLGHKHLESTQLYTRVKNKQLWNLQSKS